MSERDDRDRPAREPGAAEPAPPREPEDDLDEESLAVLAEAGERTSGPELAAIGPGGEGDPISEPGDRGEIDEVDVRDLLRAALRPPPGAVAPSLLGGVQRRLRVRSRGKFYGDGWSTARAPRSTYLFTSLLMLAVIVLVYFVLVPWSGSAVP